MNKRFAAVDRRFDELEKRLDGRIDGLTHYVLEMRQETVMRFNAIENRLEGVLPAVAAMDMRLPPRSKSVADLGTTFSRMLAESRTGTAVSEIAGGAA